MAGTENKAFNPDEDEKTTLELEGPRLRSLSSNNRKKSTVNDGVEIAVNGEYLQEKEETLTKTHQEPHKGDVISRFIDGFWKSLGKFVTTHKIILQILFLIAFNVAIAVYFVFATLYWNDHSDCVWEWCDGYGLLIILLGLVYGLLFYFLVLKRYFGQTVYDGCWVHVENYLGRIWRRWLVVRLVVYLLPLAALLVFMALDTVGSRERLISLVGLIVLMLLGFVFSKHPGQINWRPVFWGLGLQFIFGLLTIRWSVGRDIFRCIGDKAALFLSYTNDGSSFVYGNALIYDSPVFAFQVLSVIYFFSFMISILSYYGALQWFIMKLGWLLQISLGTSVCESVNAAASIFLGMSESPLLIKPFIKDLTRSELHALMTAGFATVAGTVLAAYISFGVSPAHLVTASVMSAPAALCYSKLFYPETEESKTRVSNIVMEKRTETSVLDAATKGAFAAIELVLGILSNIIAFVAFIAFANALLSWAGGLVGWDFLDFQYILSKIFIPLSWLLGVSLEDCESVAYLIGLKTIVNEFVAYERLGAMKRACVLSPRSEAIATYALCGFANPGSIGILVGALATMAPTQRSKIASVAFRAFLAGSATCFLTACIAGMLLTPGPSFTYIVLILAYPGVAYHLLTTSG